jgi:hypothetical protein
MANGATRAGLDPREIDVQGSAEALLGLWGEARGREVEPLAADVLPHLGR